VQEGAGMNKVQIFHGLCEEVLKEFADNSFDSIVTDPPYGISFMGKKWDYEVPSVEIWRECLRVLKPGGYLLSFAGTRTQHRMACNIEDAGFEIRDMIAWVYGSGFPKSLNIGKAVDKIQGNERSVVGHSPYEGRRPNKFGGKENGDICYGDYKAQPEMLVDKGTSDFEGWGTALKPALEPITVARKPLEKGLSVAENCLKWGTGGININGCRIEVADDDRHEYGVSGDENPKKSPAYGEYGRVAYLQHEQGRFPSNFIHDGSQEVLGLFPINKSTIDKSNHAGRKGTSTFAGNEQVERIQRGDSGSAARFFYCAKASKQDRDEGLESRELQAMNDLDKMGGSKCTMKTGSGNERNCSYKNNHPTVKPTNLMRYLCRLVTPPKGIILDPFCGSGSTGKAAILEGFSFVGIDREIESVRLAEARINIDPLLRQINDH
jgi:site-specific DNA-methyltransferase (adenine-specific)